MRKLLLLIFLLPALALASNGPRVLQYEVAATINFKLYNADGTLDVDEADGGAEVTLSCDEGAFGTATNDFVDEGDSYSILISAAELKCARLAVSVAATDKEVFFITTCGSPNAQHMFCAGGPYRSGGTAGAGTTTSVTLQSGDNYALDVLTGDSVYFVEDLGIGQKACITSNTADTPPVVSHTTVDVAADNTTEYIVVPDNCFAVNASNGVLEAKVVGHSSGVIDAAAIATDAIGASELAADAIGSSELALTAVQEIRDGIGLAVLAGTADSGTSTSFVDAALTQADANYWSKDIAVVFTSGNISGQVVCVSSFAPGTDTINFTPATTQAVGTNTYILIAAPGCDPYR